MLEIFLDAKVSAFSPWPAQMDAGTSCSACTVPQVNGDEKHVHKLQPAVLVPWAQRLACLLASTVRTSPGQPFLPTVQEGKHYVQFAWVAGACRVASWWHGHTGIPWD